MINLQKYRWAARIFLTAVFLILPFICVDGRSAFRLDIPSMQLMFFGSSVYVENFFILLILTFFFIFFGILITQLYGRIWCGWLCPQTVFINLTSFFDRKGMSAIGKIASHVGVLIISGIISSAMVFYFVSPYDFFSDLSKGQAGSVTMGFITVLTVITYLNFSFIRYKFCTTVCPYSKLQSVMYDKSTLIVAMDPDTRDKCIKCRACVKACPVGLDIREGLVSACINCGQCITACAKVMKKHNEKTLVHYIFGFDKIRNTFRVNVLITGAVTMLFLGIFVYMAATAEPYEFEVFPNQGFMPMAKGDNVINSYDIMLKNLTSKEMKFTLSLDDMDKYKIQYDSPVTVKPGDTVKQTVFLFIPQSKTEDSPILSLEMKAQPDDKSVDELESDISFRRPITAHMKHRDHDDHNHDKKHDKEHEQE